MIQRVAIVMSLMILLVACSSSDDAPSASSDKNATATPDLSTPNPGAGASGVTLGNNGSDDDDDSGITVETNVDNTPTSGANNNTNAQAQNTTQSNTAVPNVESTNAPDAPQSVPSNVPIVPDSPTLVNQSAGCERRYDLPLYSVQAGENLTVIAGRFGVTVAEMIDWNCLANPNRLLRNDLLHIPAPETNPDPVCPQAIQQTDASDGVAIVPSANFDGTCYRLTIRTTVTLSWFSDDIDLSEVTFYYANDNLDAAEILGIDATPSDGFSVRWTIPQGLTPSLVYATGIGENGEVASSDNVGVYIPQAQ